jgi:hypothetical protein
MLYVVLIGVRRKRGGGARAPPRNFVPYSNYEEIKEKKVE